MSLKRLGRHAIPLVCIIFTGAQASQWGPVFPTHDYPTDRSFLMNSYVDYGTESGVFDEQGKRAPLAGSLSRIRLVLNPEYQPSRELSLGAFLNIDSLSYAAPDNRLSKAGLADQFLFGEYRFYDKPGLSFGAGTVFKIPAYAVPKQVDNSTVPFLLLGDGQIDGTLLGTSEYWPARNVKLFADLGFTYRADGHASEIPYKVGAAYVTPKYKIGFDLTGNFSMGNDRTHLDKITQNIQTLNGGTNYVFADNPSLFIGEIYGEYSMSYQWALSANFANSISGKNAPYFYNGGVGISYRFFDPQAGTRTAREVDLGTDDSSDVFDGEIQEGMPEKLGDPGDGE